MQSWPCRGGGKLFLTYLRLCWQELTLLAGADLARQELTLLAGAGGFRSWTEDSTSLTVVLGLPQERSQSDCLKVSYSLRN